MLKDEIMEKILIKKLTKEKKSNKNNGDKI
jgi:hypothetical protein